MLTSLENYSNVHAKPLQTGELCLQIPNPHETTARRNPLAINPKMDWALAVRFAQVHWQCIATNARNAMRIKQVYHDQHMCGRTWIYNGTHKKQHRLVVPLVHKWWNVEIVHVVI